MKKAHFERADHERVVITGMGAITPVGNDLASIWANLTQGKSGIMTGYLLGQVR